MNWKILQQETQLSEIIADSFVKPQVIFKHSTRCSISDVAKARLERNDFPNSIDFHYLDLIAFRGISNRIAEMLQVQHESPQVLLIKNGKCCYHESHMTIQFNDIIERAAAC